MKVSLNAQFAFNAENRVSDFLTSTSSSCSLGEERAAGSAVRASAEPKVFLQDAMKNKHRHRCSFDRDINKIAFSFSVILF